MSILIRKIKNGEAYDTCWLTVSSSRTSITIGACLYSKYHPVLLGEGKIPIIAHPERNRAIAEKPERLERLVRHGALAQVTAGSLSGHFGKNVQKLALQLIEANLIHTYGSDVHNLDDKTIPFQKGLDYLGKKKTT